MFYSKVQHLGPMRPDRTEPAILTEGRELDSRASDGIHVRLLWHPSEDRAWVAVSDTKTGEAFELPVREGQSAIDVFRHPFAYATCHTEGRGERVPSAASRSS